MTQEEKQLLLQDLCARLPYGVYVLVHDTFKYSTVPYENVYLKSSDIASLIDSISLNKRYNRRDRIFNKIIKEQKDYLEFKPYLRPMSSMTEEEINYLARLLDYKVQEDKKIDGFYTAMVVGKFIDSKLELLINFLNEYHFDYRGLIPMGLALEAPDGMYNN